MIGNRLAEPGPELDAGEDPVTRWQAVVFDVGGLGLEHQARDVDPRGALGAAELAMDAQIGVGLEFVAAPELGVDLAGGDLADQVGLRPGRGGLTARARDSSGTCAWSDRGNGRCRSRGS